MEKEAIIQKVQKLLALTTNNYEGEANAAMLQAQKLLAKYHLTLEECTNTLGDEKVVELTTTFSAYNRWVRNLGHIIAENFRCNSLIAHGGNKYRVLMVGFETDAKIATNVFEYAVKFIDRTGTNLAQTYADKGRSSKGVKADYIDGFLFGLMQGYSEQRTSTEEMALVLVVPTEVTEHMKQFSTGSFPNAAKGNGNLDAFNSGTVKGKDFANRGQNEITQ